MKKPRTTDWTCPDCGEVIPVQLEHTDQGKGRTLRFVVKNTALADVATHVWAHTERA